MQAMEHSRTQGRVLIRRAAARCLALGLWLLIAPLLMASSVSHAGQAGADRPQSLTFGVFAYRPKSVVMEAWQPLADYFSDHLPAGVEVELRVLTQPEMQAALAADELDLIFTNPTHFVELRSRNQLSGALATLVALHNDQPTSQLGGVVIRRSDADGPDSLEELSDHAIAVVGRQLLGGFAVQVGELKRLGISLEQLKILETGGNHDSVVDAVREGQAEVGFVRTGVLEAKLRDGTLMAGEISVVAPQHYADFPFATSTRLYPEWPFVAHWSLPREVSKQIASLLFDLSPHHPAAQAAGIAGFTIPADYHSVEALMISQRLPPFDRAPDFVWADVWQRYQAALVTGGILAGVILALLALVGWGYRRQRRLKGEARELAGRLIETQQTWIQRFREFADNVPGVLFQFRLRPDGSSHFPFASPRLFEIYGCHPAEVEEGAEPVFRVIHPDDRAGVERSILESAATLTPWRAAFRVKHPLAGLRWLEGSSSPSPQEDGSIIWHGHIRDITEFKQQERELEFIAYYDPLTGIPNRRLLSDRLAQAIAHAIRSGEALAVCMLDLDNFKPINDTYGHVAGDHVLIEIARRLNGLLRTEDSVARLGGDEFVLLLRNPEGEAVFQRVLEELRAPICLGSTEVSVSGSLGVVMLDSAAPCDGDQLLRLADQAAYRAKSAGRDRFHVITASPGCMEAHHA